MTDEEYDDLLEQLLEERKRRKKKILKCNDTKSCKVVLFCAIIVKEKFMKYDGT